MTHSIKIDPEAATLQTAYQRLRRENLVSLILIATGRIETDLKGIRLLSDFAQARLDYHEILVVAAEPSREWDRRLRQHAQDIQHLRVLSISSRDDYEGLVAQALHHAIGDYILCMAPQAATERDLDQLLARIAEGRFDIVKAVHDPAKIRLGERLAARVTRMVLRLATGQRIEPFQARAFVLTRMAMSRLEQIGGMLKFFRILDLSAHLTQDRITVEQGARRTFLTGFAEKTRLSAELVSLSSERLVLSFSLLCLGLSVLSLTVTIGAVIIKLIWQDVAPGWASLAVLFSGLFAANFGVLSAICLGLLQLLRQGRGQQDPAMASEISGGDFYHADAGLNVKGADEDK